MLDLQELLGSNWGSGGFFQDCLQRLRVQRPAASLLFRQRRIAPRRRMAVAGRQPDDSTPWLPETGTDDWRSSPAGKDNALWHTWQVAPNGKLVRVGLDGRGQITSDPCAVSKRGWTASKSSPGARIVGCWHLWQTAPNNGWSGWASLGGKITSNPAGACNKDGRIEIFARGLDGALWHVWQTAVNNGWSGWASMGAHFSGTPAVAQNADGRLEVFFVGMDNAIWHIWQTAPNNGWSGWASRAASSPPHRWWTQCRWTARGFRARPGQRTVAHLADRAQQRLVGVGVIRRRHHQRGRRRAATQTGAWKCSPKAWTTRSGTSGRPAPSNGWSGWSSLGGILSDGPAVGSNADGRLEVFARGAALNLIHTWQTAPNNGWN